MEQFCLPRGLTVGEWVTEAGGDMNLQRKESTRMMEAIERGAIATRVVTPEVRLARFGFDCLDHVARHNDRDIVVANHESLSPENKLVRDLLAIVRTSVRGEGGPVWLAVPDMTRRANVPICLSTTLAPSGTLRLILRGGVVEVHYQVDDRQMVSTHRLAGNRTGRCRQGIHRSTGRLRRATPRHLVGADA